MLSTIMVGIVEMSSAWRARHVLQSAAREGARVASLTPNLRQQDPVVRSLVDQMLRNSGLSLSNNSAGEAAYDTTVAFELLDSSRDTLAPGDPVTVRIAYRYEPVVVGLFPGMSSLELSMHSTMRYQWRGSGSVGGGTFPGSNPVESPSRTPGGGRDSEPFAYHPIDTRGQGNLGRPCMRDPHGFDDRPIDETGNQGRPHNGCVE